MAKKGHGIFLVYADIDPKHEEEFNAWYNTEHLPELLSLPGFLDAARYMAYKGVPKYLAVYELESAEALKTAEFQKWRANPQPMESAHLANGHRQEPVSRYRAADLPGRSREARSGHGASPANRPYVRSLRAPIKSGTSGTTVSMYRVIARFPGSSTPDATASSMANHAMQPCMSSRTKRCRKPPIGISSVRVPRQDPAACAM